MSQYTTCEDIIEEAKSPHVTADILVSCTKELTAEKEHELQRLEKLLSED